MRKALWALTASAVLLAGCGGGGGDNDNDGGEDQTPPVTDAAGFYFGTTSNGLSQVSMLFQDGSFYALYVNGDDESDAGFLVGDGEAKNGSFTSTNAKEFHAGGSTSATVSASYLAKKSLNGSVSLAGTPPQTLSFTGEYDSFYEGTPVLSSLVGTYQGVVVTPLAGEESSLTIATDGKVSGTSQSGCSFTGTVKPKSAGNAFDVEITLGAAPCPDPGQKQAGMAISDSGAIIAIVATSNKSTGTLVIAEQNVPR